MLELCWEERDGPPVTEPTTRGFGTRSVIASIGSQLGGRADFDWRTEGLLCRLTVPLEQASAQLLNDDQDRLPAAAGQVR